MSIQDLPVSILKLKAAFDTGLSRPLGWRRKQIEGIHGKQNIPTKERKLIVATDLVQKNTESLVGVALKGPFFRSGLYSRLNSTYR
jgi:hypothetical protein